MVGGALVPWLVGAVCSLISAVEYGHLVDFDVCRQSVVYRRQIAHDRRTVSWTGALVVIYWVATMVAGASLSVAYFWNRKLLASTLLRRDRAMSRDRSGLLRDDGRRRTSSCMSAAGSSSSDLGAADSEQVSRHNSSRKKRLTRKQSAERGNKTAQVRPSRAILTRQIFIF